MFSLINPNLPRPKKPLKYLPNSDELLQKNPKIRLGGENGILDILNHNWCRKTKINEVVT